MKINDQFTDLPVSRQRKHQLRYPEKAKLLVYKYQKSAHGKEKKHEAYVRNKELINERTKQRYIRLRLPS